MDLLKTLVPQLIAFIDGLFAKPRLFNRGMKKIRTATESHDLFDKYDTPFKEEFILQDLKESYFYAQTGIYTNEKSIKKYIDFKNRIGGNCTWITILVINDHLNLDGDLIQIKLERWQSIYANLSFIIGALLCFGGVGFSCYLFSYLNKGAITEFVIIVSIMMLSIFIGIFLIYQARSIIIARGIHRKLHNIGKREIEKIDHETMANSNSSS